MPWPWQFSVGGERVMKVFSCLSRWGWGRNERDRSQLPSVLPVSLHAEAHPGQAVFHSHRPVCVSPGWHRGGQQEPSDPVLSGHLWPPNSHRKWEHMRWIWWVSFFFFSPIWNLCVRIYCFQFLWRAVMGNRAYFHKPNVPPHPSHPPNYCGIRRHCLLGSLCLPGWKIII